MVEQIIMKHYIIMYVFVSKTTKKHDIKTHKKYKKK